MNHRLDRLWIVLAMLMGLAHADTLDDFTNNLVSDLGPILALFGERVTMQFMSESLGFSDCVVLAMAPLGIITIIVSAIRVGGPARLKAIIGRASENRSAAEMEVMSSTSSEVCEMFNGQGIVRCQGSAPVWEYICLVPSEGTDEQLAGGKIIFKTLKEAVKENLLHADPPLKVEGEGFESRRSHPIRRMFSVFNWCRESRHPKSSPSSTETASQKQPPDYLTDMNIVVIRNTIDKAPNISLNLSNHHKRTFIRCAAFFGFTLQLGVLAFFAAITYHPRIRLDFKKETNSVPEYACPLAAGGTTLLVAGMLLCAHVVESSTCETRYTVNGSGSHEMHLFWLQQKQTVSDQVFESFAIQPKSCSASFITSHRDDDNAKKTSEGALQVKTIIGVVMGLAGFFCQFVGLRQMNSAASLAQLIAVCIMTVVRAFARPGIERSLGYHKLLPGFELDWFAWKLLQIRPAKHHQSTTRKMSEPQKTQNAAEKRHRAPGWWTVDNHWTEQQPPQKFQKSKTGNLDGKPSQRIGENLEGPINLVRMRRELGTLARYKGETSTISLSLATAMEKTLNVFLPSGIDPDVDVAWEIAVHCNSLISSESKLHLKLRYNSDLGSWKVRADDLDAVLTLWTYTIRAWGPDDVTGHDKADIATNEDLIGTRHNMSGLKRVKADDSDKDDWFRSETHPRSVRILGPVYNRLTVIRDLEWWTDAAVSTTLKFVDGNSLLEFPTENLQSPMVQFGHDGRPLNWQESSDLERALKRAVSLDLMPQKVPPQEYWAVWGHDSLGLRCAKELLFSFVCSAAISRKRPLPGKVHVETTDYSGTDRGFSPHNHRVDHFRNNELSRLVGDFVQLGFGFEDEASLAIFLPLSIWNKLPLPWAAFDSFRAKVTDFRKRKDWVALSYLFAQTRLFWDGSSKRPLSQHGFVLLVESIHDIESEIWLKKIEGRERTSNEKDAQEYRSCLIDSVKLFTDYRIRLDDLTILFSQYDRDVGLLARLKNRKGDEDESSKYDHESSDEDESDKSTDDETEEPKGKGNGTSSRSKHTPKWLKQPQKWQTWHIQSRTSILRRKPPNPEIPDYFDVTDSHLGLASLPLDSNARDISGSSPLHYASTAREAARLLRNTADPNATNLRGYTPAHYAFAHGKEDICIKLKSFNADFECQGSDGAYPIHLAAASRNADFIRFLKDPSMKVNWLLKDFDGRCAIHWAAIGGHQEVIKELGHLKDEPDSRGWTALHLAVLHRQLDIIDVLCEMRADKEVTDEQKRTPLALACHRRDMEAADRLIKAGAKIDDEVLHWAVSFCKRGELEILGAALSEFETKWPLHTRYEEWGGNTLLHTAVERQNVDAVKMLMEMGADTKAEDVNGDTPADLAAEVKSVSREIYKALRKRHKDKKQKASWIDNIWM